MKKVVKTDRVTVMLGEVAEKGSCITHHTLQFIKLYFIHLYDNNIDFPLIDKKFVICVQRIFCIKDRRGSKSSDETIALMRKLEEFKNLHYEVNGDLVNRTNLSTMLDYLAESIVTKYEVSTYLHLILVYLILNIHFIVRTI